MNRVIGVVAAVGLLVGSVGPAHADQFVFSTDISTGVIASTDVQTGVTTPFLTLGTNLDSLFFTPGSTTASGTLVASELNAGNVVSVNIATKAVTTLATGLSGPIDMAQASPTSFYVADSTPVAGVYHISLVSLSGGVLNTFAVNGRPDGLFVGANGNLYANISGGFYQNNSVVEEFSTTSGGGTLANPVLIATSANSGTFLDGMTFVPTTDPSPFAGNLISVDALNGKLVAINPITLALTSLTTTGATITGGAFPPGGPDGDAADGMGNVFVASRGNGQLIEVNLSTLVATVPAAGNPNSIPGIDDLAPLVQPTVATATPEPSALTLLGIGALSAWGYARRGRRGQKQ